MPDSSAPRMTLPTQLVLRVLLERQEQEIYGLEISRLAGLPTGTIHPILARLERLTWIESQWEDASPHEIGRPRRRYYRLAPNGAEKALAALSAARTSIDVLAATRPIPQPGV